LEFAVITGCLRISKESIFTGLNNLEIISILSEHYDEYFGFTQNEIDAMLAHYKLECNTETMKKWYDGYLFGKAEVYNPWSAINCMSNWVKNPDYFPRPFWANTSGNDIVRKLIDMAGSEAKAELGTLISGGYISKTIHEDITYNEIEDNIDNIWNFLFFTGYLKKVGERKDGVKIALDLAVPNLELQYIYETKIQEWFKEKIKQKDFSKFYAAILEGNVEAMQAEISEMLMASVSYMDFREDFYHGFMLGILSKFEDYTAKSNRERGSGRSEVILRYGNIWGKAVIFEFKFTKNIKELESDALEALEQIEKENYVFELEEEGYKKENILKYGIAFCKKNCLVKM
jgi:hypothetical protein